jgi:hypothetical protein
MSYQDVVLSGDVYCVLRMVEKNPTDSRKTAIKRRRLVRYSFYALFSKYLSKRVIENGSPIAPNKNPQS